MSKKFKKFTILTLIITCLLIIIDNTFQRHQVSLAEDRSRMLYYIDSSVETAFQSVNNVQNLVKKIKLHKEMWEAYYFYNASQILSSIEQRQFLESLKIQEEIYPFNKRYFASVWDLYSYYSGKGIVMTTDDLSIQNQRILKKEGVILTDASKLLSPLRANTLHGWAIKPFAMLMSRFQEFVFLDSDVLFFQNPQNIFNFKSYIETGTLYYRDRTIKLSSKPTLNFFRMMVPHPSRFARNGRIWRDTSLHEGESGVIVMDKKRGGMFVLLLASLLNINPIKDMMYKVIFGDKESYWMSSEALGVPYRWGPGGGGTVGYPNPNSTSSICGGLYHVDDDWEPLWFNGGIHMNKHFEVGRTHTLEISHYAIDRTFGYPHWEWEAPTHPFCLSPENPKSEIGELSPHYKRVGQMMRETWDDLETV